MSFRVEQCAHCEKEERVGIFRPVGWYEIGYGDLSSAPACSKTCAKALIDQDPRDRLSESGRSRLREFFRSFIPLHGVNLEPDRHAHS